MGGTDLATKSVVGPETTWSCGGGGFSDTFPIPAYQASQVASYLANPAAKLPAASYFNSSGRAYPDVSALGGQVNSYCVVTGGTYKGVAGTSAACPVVAGLIGRLNDVRFNAGKPALGFLNPFIYATAGPAGCFNDVADGSTNVSVFLVLNVYVSDWYSFSFAMLAILAWPPLLAGIPPPDGEPPTTDASLG